MINRKSCRRGFNENLTERDIKGLKTIYRRIFELKSKSENNNLNGSEDSKSSSWLNISSGILGKSNTTQSINENDNFTYLQFEEEFTNYIMVDHPDNTLMRYLRARKHNADLAFKMIYNSVKFLHNQNFQKIIENGELDLLQYPLESGLFYFCGRDLSGNIIMYLQPKHHKPKEAPVEKFSKIMMYAMGQGYLFLGKGKATAVIDLKGLTLSNVEYTNVRLGADILANYMPEILNKVFIINAPWIFSGIWSIITTFLDPIVKENIQFCNQSDLQKFIALDQIPISLGGTNSFEYKYKTPKKFETIVKKKDERYYSLQSERKQLMLRFFDVTMNWINGESVVDERDELAQKLSDNYRMLAPYNWSPSYYHRKGIITGFDDSSF